MKRFLGRPKYIYALFALLFFTLLIRLYNLTTIPVFVDEAIYIRWSQVMAAVPSLKFLPLTDGKQPLFMWILMLFVRKLSDPLVAGRLISVFSGAASALGVYFLTSLLFKSKKAATLALIFWAVSPFALFFDRLALVDSLLAATGVWTFYFAVLAMKRRSYKFAVVSGVILGLAMLTKSPALFLLILVPSTWLFVERSRGYLKNAVITVIILVIGFGMYNVLRLDANFHLLASRNFDYVYPYGHILSSPLDPLKGHLGGIWNYFVELAPLGLTLLIVLSILANIKKFPRETIFLVILGIAPILVVAEYSKVVTARYILFVLPFLITMAGAVVLARVKTLKVVGTLAIIIFFAQSAYVDTKLLTDVYAAPLPQGERSGYLEELDRGAGDTRGV